MKSSEFVNKVYALNLVAGVNEVQEVAKDLFPECEISEMGYNGGYSHVIEEGEMVLRDYLGNINEKDEKDDIFENLEYTDYAFGTIFIESDDSYYQIYHKGIGQWAVEDSENKHTELGSYDNAISYILKLDRNIN